MLLVILHPAMVSRLDQGRTYCYVARSLKHPIHGPAQLGLAGATASFEGLLRILHPSWPGVPPGGLPPAFNRCMCRCLPLSPCQERQGTRRLLIHCCGAGPTHRLSRFNHGKPHRYARPVHEKGCLGVDCSGSPLPQLTLRSAHPELHPERCPDTATSSEQSKAQFSVYLQAMWDTGRCLRRPMWALCSTSGVGGGTTMQTSSLGSPPTFSSSPCNPFGLVSP